VTSMVQVHPPWQVRPETGKVGPPTEPMPPCDDTLVGLGSSDAIPIVVVLFQVRIPSGQSEGKL
jgi:hypothetical protein